VSGRVKPGKEIQAPDDYKKVGAQIGVQTVTRISDAREKF